MGTKRGLARGKRKGGGNRLGEILRGEGAPQEDKVGSVACRAKGRGRKRFLPERGDREKEDEAPFSKESFSKEGVEGNPCRGEGREGL